MNWKPYKIALGLALAVLALFAFARFAVLPLLINPGIIIESDAS